MAARTSSAGYWFVTPAILLMILILIVPVFVAAAISFLRAWRDNPARTARRAPELLIDADGELRLDVMRRLAARGDRRPLFLRE